MERCWTNQAEMSFPLSRLCCNCITTQLFFWLLRQNYKIFRQRATVSIFARVFVKTSSFSFASAASHSERIYFIRLSIFLRCLLHRSFVHEFLIEALARIWVPSTNNVLPSIRPSFIQRRAHCLSTCVKADLLFLRNSAMVLWSGFRPQASQIKDRL